MNFSVIFQIICGFVFADLGGGVFHWFEDTYLDYCVNFPILSQIAKDNEMHHYFPRSILSYSYYENVSSSIPIVITAIVLILLINRTTFTKYPYFWITFFAFSLFANLIHRFSHSRECENNAAMLLLQKTGLLCSHEHHKMHHDKIKEKYCVISQYNNYWLDTFEIWRILEFIIYAITGVSPNRKPPYSDYYEIHTELHENAKQECPVKPSAKDVAELSNKLRLYKNCNKQ
jgi:ubiquitin-conjugating enzyme E2 variant